MCIRKKGIHLWSQKFSSWRELSGFSDFFALATDLQEHVKDSPNVDQSKFPHSNVQLFSQRWTWHRSDHERKAWENDTRVLLKVVGHALLSSKGHIRRPRSEWEVGGGRGGRRSCSKTRHCWKTCESSDFVCQCANASEWFPCGEPLQPGHGGRRN